MSEGQKVEPGLKFDGGKCRVDLLPPDGLLAIANVLTYGAEKYAARNWERGMSRGRLAGGLLRHVFARMSGERQDPETGMPHLAHAGCCVLMWLCHDLRDLGHDDFAKQLGAPGNPSIIAEPSLDEV